MSDILPQDSKICQTKKSMYPLLSRVFFPRGCLLLGDDPGCGEGLFKPATIGERDICPAIVVGTKGLLKLSRFSLESVGIYAEF